MTRSLYSIYDTLRQHFGPLYGGDAAQPWWPLFSDDPPFEVLVGAVLVQQTRWEAVEAAVQRLQDADLLSPPALAAADEEALGLLLRPVAFYRQKAPGLIRICQHICDHYAGSTAAMLAQPTATLRDELLALPRIGPETADVVLLYGGAHASFVVDEYTRRLFERVTPTLASPLPNFDWRKSRYGVVQQQIAQELGDGGQGDKEAGRQGESNKRTNEQTIKEQTNTRHTTRDTRHAVLFADYHAQINETCVRYCLTRPRCDGPPARRVYSRQQGRNSYLDRDDGCPLRSICLFYQQQKAL